MRLLASYRVSWLRRDLVAGLVLSTLLVPQGMAYAELAGLPAITGLYTTVLCLIGYAAFGPSRVLVLGPDSSLGPMIAATLLPIIGSGGDPGRAIALASMLALLVAAIEIGAGVAKLGFVADLLSKPTRIGYMNGLALTILIGQLPKLFGFSTDANGLIDEAQKFVRGLASGDAVAGAAGLGAVSLALILLLQRWLPRIPGVLVAVVAAIAATSALDLSADGVSLVGTLPEGLPSLTWPSPVSDFPLLFAGALGIALVSLTDTISTASAFGARTGQEIDGNKEMIGIGAANIGAGLFQGFPVSTSGSRTAVAEQSGAKTQLTGLVGAAAIVLMLVLVPGLLRNLPQTDSSGRRDRRLPVAGRHRGDQAAVAPAAGRVHALGGRVPRCGATRSARRHRRRRGAVDPQRIPPGLVALPDHPRACLRDARAITTGASTPMRRSSPGL